MSNSIRRVIIKNQSITPNVAEILVTVFPEQITPTTEVRGRLMGPTCQFASTVEVAYHLRPLPKGQEAPVFDEPSLTMAVSIPEPSLWDPVSPFLYHGQVELWDEGRRRGRLDLRHALSFSKFTPSGLVWNGRPLALRGMSTEALEDVDALALRACGYNLLVVQGTRQKEGVWDLADRLGFLILNTRRHLHREMPSGFSTHPSRLGWVIEGDFATPREQELFRELRSAIDGPIGLAPMMPTSNLPPGIDFVVCAPEQCANFAGLGVPVFPVSDSEG